ncbi:MAG: Pyridinium-3,5-biscarboxylic acid mononucleotide sulfurtransferase [Phycisphaerae bacterium]|nr:Pyridinium-3,5-biscarboxylic acid mononucleotide sulfurtransferase [Phycisphaerae bacterium]
MIAPRAADCESPDSATADDSSAARLDALLAGIRRVGRAIVAFSGGVDSAVVLRLAVLALGRSNVLAVTARSPSVPADELAAAAGLAAELGADHEFVETREFDDPNYLANPANRCYFCKTELYAQLADLAARRRFRAVLNGVNADDLGDYRPGLTAAAERGVLAPLADAGVGKAGVRRLAARLGLSVADKPASPCLSSRVQYGEAITEEKLRRIDAAEAFLRELGFRELRVRHHDDLARIEVPAAELARFADAQLRDAVAQRLRALGYRYVTLDLMGFRSGSMNEVLIGPGLRGVQR